MASRLGRALVAAACGAAMLTAAACTPSAQPDPPPSASPSPSPSPEPEPVSAELQVPSDPATVVAGADATSRSVGASSAFFASAPLVVLAPPDDVAALVRAGALAVALGVPVLASPFVNPEAELDADLLAAGAAVTAEVARLDATAALTVGDAGVPDGLAALAAPDDPDALEDLLDVRFADAETPAAGGELAAVIALDGSAPTLPAHPSPAEPGSDPAATAEPTASPDPTASPEPSEEPTDEPATEDEPEDEPAAELPLVERPDPVTGAALLTTGDPVDVAAAATARAAGVPVLSVPTGDPRASSATVQAMAATAPTAVVGLGEAFGDAEHLTWTSATAATGVELPGGGQTLFPGRRIVALYGTPVTTALGLLGEQGLEASIARAQDYAAEYQALTDDVVVPGFEIIVTVASAGAGGDGNYSNELPVESFVPWIEAARDAGVYVVIDLQPGRTDFLTQAQQYEELLRYPNVGLALDPEWRLEPGEVHMRQIGSVTAAEVNTVSTWLADLVRTERLPQKLLVLHQFQHRMISNRETVDTSRDELAFLIHVDGQGSQPAKADTWRSLHTDAPPNVTWGWKNFIDEDLPMLTPEQTYQVEPLPELVTYQ